MASVTSHAASVESPLSLPALPAPVWAALASTAGKHANRDQLLAGSSHAFHLTISGDVDGQPLAPTIIAGKLNIGHDGTRASSVVPALPQVVAAILAKLNPATREAVCRDLPAEFVAGGFAFPKLAVSQVEQAESLLAGLRASKTGKVRGSVTCEAAIVPAAPVFGLVG